MKLKTSALAVIAGAFAVAFAPAETVLPSVWAAQNIVLPDGPHKGEKFNPAITPYLVEPLDFFASDCPDNAFSFKKSKQIGVSTLAICAVAYRAVVEPSDQFLIEPTDANLTDFNSEKLARTIEASPAFKARIYSQTARSGKGSTTYSKRYPGGSLLMGIATSTADLRGKTRNVVIEDEASEYPVDLDGQGSPHDMIAGSYESFLASGDWKHATISTPVVAGECHIEEGFKAGDQRYWHMDCPGCGEPFRFDFKPQKTFRFSETFPHNAHYVTECCGTVIEGHQKNALVRSGCKASPRLPAEEQLAKLGIHVRNGWIATAAGPGKRRSYHFDALSSPFVPWDTIATRYVEAKDNAAKLKTFDNLTLGRAHEIKGDAPDHVRLMALSEDYERLRIPPRGLLLTGAADVQANAIYYLITAYAPDRQSWAVDAGVLDGDTTDPNGGAFAKLSEIFEREYGDSFGGQRRVDAFAVDTGFRTHIVYTWVRGKPNAYAVDGRDGWTRPAISTPTLVDIDIAGRKIKQGCALWPIGTWSIKANLYADLGKLRLAEGAAIEPPGACHHGRWLDDGFFKQITAEHLVQETFRGRPRRVWKPTGPNHWLDCEVYNRALADYLGLSRLTADEWKILARHRGWQDDAIASDLFAPDPLRIAAATVTEAAPVAATSSAPPPAPAADQRTSGWWS